MCGSDLPVPECQLVIHQPRIRDIALIGEKTYFEGAQYLCIDKLMISQDESVLENTSNFQVFMTIMNQKEQREIKKSVQQVLSLLFPNNRVLFTPRSLILSKEGNEDVLIDENNFELLQEVFRQVFGYSQNTDSNNYNPQNAAAAEIARKLMRGRQRIAAEKGSQDTTLGQYISSLVIGLNAMSLNDVIDLTLYQLYDLVQRYTLYVNWDLDIRTRLAGGTPDKPPENWMKNIH